MLVRHVARAVRACRQLPCDMCHVAVTAAAAVAAACGCGMPLCQIKKYMTKPATHRPEARSANPHMLCI
jgi:hypothetical protein